MIAALILTAGTVLNSDTIGQPPSTVCDDSPVASSACDILDISKKSIGTDRGVPFSFLADFEETGERLKDAGVTSFNGQTIGFDTQNFIYSYGFWLIISALGYFAFTKLRNTVGTLVLAGIGVACAGVYFGVLAL